MPEQLFAKHRNQIRDRAWRYAQKWNADFEELEAQGYLIFVEALERYDPDQGAAFSTYLHHRLRGLNDFCRREARLGYRVWPFEFNEESGDPGPHDPFFIRFCEILELREAQTQLSPDARVMLRWLLDGQWREYGVPKSRPFFSGVVRAFRREWGWTTTRVADGWAELQAWWAGFSGAGYPGYYSFKEAGEI